MKKTLIFQLSLIFIALSLSGCTSTKTPTTPQEQLNRAAEQGDESLVKKLLDEGVEPAGQGVYEDGIWWAEGGGHHKIVKMLIDRCLEIYVPGKNCFSLPGWVAVKGNTAILSDFLAKGNDPNQLDGNGNSLLFHAVSARNDANAKLLVARGADIDQAVQVCEAKMESAKMKEAIAFLNTLRQEARVEFAVPDPQEEERFVRAAQDYGEAVNKPVLPEEARKFKVQAEGAVRDKKFDEAAKLYSKALNIAPWWPEGHFNRAIVLGENRYYQGAIHEMKRYLALVPNAPDARAAQDKIYEWERKAGK